MALKVTLHALRDRLSIGEAAQLGAQLPMMIRGLFYESWRPAGKPDRASTWETFMKPVYLAACQDGSFTPEEIVAGSFQTIGGAIAEINVEKQEIKINDLQSKQAVTIVVTKDSSLRKLTPGKTSNDLQEMFDQLPAFTLAELKVGDSILVSSTKGSDPSRVTAIAIVSGVAPLLQGNRAALSLGAMSLGGP